MTETLGDVNSPVMLWDLPTDVMNDILEKISFADYVQLMFTCKSLRRVLDNDKLYKIVWKANFATVSDAYEWPQSDEQLMVGGWRNLYGRIESVEHRLLIMEKRFEGLRKESPSVPPEQMERLRTKEIRSISMDIGTDERYFIPLVHLSSAEWDKFCRATEGKREVYDMFRMCLTRKLLYLQGVNIALCFFMKAESSHATDIEKCLFELSRFDFAFCELAIIRKRKLSDTRRAVLEELPIQTGILGFVSENMFVSFVIAIARKIISHFPTPQTHEPSLNILREYVGQTGEPRIYRLAMLAKVMQEEIFSKLSFRVNNQDQSFEANITGSELLIGKFRFRLKTDLSGIASVTESDMPARSRVNYESAIYHCRNMGHATRSIPRQNSYPCNSEDEMIWELFRDLVLQILRKPERSKKSLVDMKSWPLEPVATELLWESPALLMRSPKFSVNPSQGRIVILKTGDMGVISRLQYSTRCPFVYLYDDTRLRNIDENYSRMRIDSPATIQWLMKCRGFNCMGLYDLPGLEYVDGEFRFLALT